MFRKNIPIAVILWCLAMRFEFAVAECPRNDKPREANVNLEKSVQINHRLPGDTIPETYNISLRTGIGEGLFNYDGLIRINILIVHATRKVTLHARELTIKSIRLSDDCGAVDLLPWHIDSVNDFLTIPTECVELLPGDRYHLDIQFAGELKENQTGFFRILSETQYPIPSTDAGWIAATKFEPIFARTAFPCFDEPRLRANFTIEITDTEDYFAVSNMPGQRSENLDRTATTRFATTPMMSTHTIYFAIAAYRHIHKPTYSKFPIRIRAIGAAENSTKTRQRLVEGERAIKILENYLQVPKTDQIITAFAFDGMRNFINIVELVRNSLDYCCALVSSAKNRH